MDPVEFMLWRFRNAEGVMEYVDRWDLTTCTLNVKGESILITYDPAKETATISRKKDTNSMPITCKLSDFVTTMTALGFYKERPASTRHALSYKQTEKLL